MKISLWVLLAVSLLASGCSDTNRDAARPPVRDNPVWGEQIRALEKAQGVESTIQSGADYRRQIIEAQTE